MSIHISHHPAQLDRPEWSIMVDHDPKLATQTGDTPFNEVAEDSQTIFAGRWPYPGMGDFHSARGAGCSAPFDRARLRLAGRAARG